MKATRRSKALAALCAGAAAAVAIPAGIAVGQQSPPSTPIILHQSVKLLAKGAGAAASAYVACPAGSSAWINISLSERSGRSVASGSGYDSITCTGEIQTVRIPVVAQYKPFVVGKGLAQVSFQYCDDTGCGGANLTKTVTFTK